MLRIATMKICSNKIRFNAKKIIFLCSYSNKPLNNSSLKNSFPPDTVTLKKADTQKSIIHQKSIKDGKEKSKGKSTKKLLYFTDSARQRLAQLSVSGKLRISTKQKGCSGLSYALDYVQAPHKFDEVVQDAGITVYIDANSIMHVIGCTVDFESSPLMSGFVFRNPNITEECGCGQSFAV